MAPREVARMPLELLAQGFQQFRVLATALDLQLFSKVASRGATIPEMSGLLGFEERPTRVLLSALVAMGLLTKRGPRYRNAPVADQYLVEGQALYYGPFVEMLDRRLYDTYRNLDIALQTNRPLTADPALGNLFQTMARDPAMVRLFTRGMHANGGYWAEQLAKRVDFTRHRHVLDVGGGSGVYSIAIARRHPRMRATVFDLPGVLEVARENIREARLGDRVKTVAGDFFRDSWPKGPDVVLFSAVLHDWVPETSTALLRKAAAVLPKGGEVIIRETFLDDDGTGPLYAAMSSVTMLVETEGENYSWASYETWLREAGFGQFRRIPFRTTAASGALVARKR